MLLLCCGCQCRSLEQQRLLVGSTVAFAASAYSTFHKAITHCGHTQSSGGHQPAVAKLPWYGKGILCSGNSLPYSAVSLKCAASDTVRPVLLMGGRRDSAVDIVVAAPVTSSSVASVLDNGYVKGRRCRFFVFSWWYDAAQVG